MSSPVKSTSSIVSNSSVVAGVQSSKSPSNNSASSPSNAPSCSINNNLVESTIEIDVSPNMTIGVTVSNENPPKVAKLLPNSCMLGKLYVGDVIVSINGVQLSSTGDFLKMARPGKLKITLKRDEYCTCVTTVLPAPRPNTEAYEFEMRWRTGGMPIGILVYQTHDKAKCVILSMVESGTLASQTLKPGDHLIMVNGQSVAEKGIAKRAIMDSVNATNKVKLTVHRQIVQTTGTPAKKPPSANPKLPDFDIPLPPDVLAIMEANKTFFTTPAPASILKMTKDDGPLPAGTGGHINVPEMAPDEQPIEFDPSPKPLRVTPKRIGS